jgi:hypothetical protein
MTNYARSDVYPPEVEAIGDMRGCTDETHAHGCPCGVGGDVIERCYLCDQRDSGVLVTIDGAVHSVCDGCWSRDEVRIPLNYTEDEDDD